MEKPLPPRALQELPPFYVVTVNYWSGAHLKELVASLEPLTLVQRLIIVNHSPEERLEGLRASFPIQVIEQRNAGYGAGLNRGLKEITTGDAVALLCNPDIILMTPREVSEALRYMLAHPRVGCLIPRSVDPELNSLHACRTFYTWKSLLASRIHIFRRVFASAYRDHLYLNTNARGPVEVDWGYGAAMFYRVAAFSGRPAFDENFFLYFEDVDLCARLWREGMTVVYYPTLLFRHHFRRESHARVRFFCYHVASLLRFLKKYHGFPRRPPLLRTST